MWSDLTWPDVTFTWPLTEVWLVSTHSTRNGEANRMEPVSMVWGSRVRAWSYSMSGRVTELWRHNQKCVQQFLSWRMISCNCFPLLSPVGVSKWSWWSCMTALSQIKHQVTSKGQGFTVVTFPRSTEVNDLRWPKMTSFGTRSFVGYLEALITNLETILYNFSSICCH